MNREKTKKLIFIALTGVMAYVIAKVLKIPFFEATYLKFDFGEVPILLATVLFSPAIGIMSLFIKELLSFFISGSNILSLIADFIVAGSFIMLFYLTLRSKITAKSIIIAVVLSSVLRMVIAIPVNHVILGLQYGKDSAAVWAQMPWILSFNFVKAVAGGACFLFLYSRLKQIGIPERKKK